ncbi:hypothetical protein BDR05DRAFT_988531 [Suillus weaverae]|nr:hypothetical protein BDR05DRAFT_988531 [Suillus weaverae]
MSQLTRPLRTFEDHEGTIKAVAVFPDKRRMVTGSEDKTIRLWDLKTGVVLKKMEGHSIAVSVLAVSRDGQIIASGDYGGELITWHGYISKGIALCGQGHIRDARVAFDVASIFTNQDSETSHFLLLTKAIALFSVDQHDEAMLLIKELAAACPTTDPLARRVVETYLRVQLGIKAFDSARHDEAANHFTVAVNLGAFSSKYIHATHVDLTMLFGWDNESLCLTAHQKRCQAFLSAEFKERCSALAKQNDRILGAEIPGQGQDGYDTEPNFFHGMHQHAQISRPRPQQRPGRLKRLRLAMTKNLRSAPPPATASAPGPGPAPTHAPPTTTPPAAVPTTITAWPGNLFTRPPHHATPPVVDVPFAQGKERNAAAGAPGKNSDIVPYEDQDLDTTQPDTNMQQQQQAVAVHIDPDEHGGGKSLFRVIIHA